MKKFTILFLALNFSAVSIGQTNVYLKISHLLGGSNFSYNTQATNNLNDVYEFTRLEYYLSEIKLTYDGGQDTVLSDTYLLVRGNLPVNELLGTFNFTTLEAISFGIGVDAARNHADPATYSSGHPLGFQMPSMHWGWTAGYRFAAIEGNSGASMNQTWEIHALGDKNYGMASITTAGIQQGNNLIIDLDADYQQAFKDITVNSTLNYHGEDQTAPVLLGNFKNEVFTKAGANVGLNTENLVAFSMSPNPTNGRFFITAEAEKLSNANVVVLDITGRVVTKEAINANSRKELQLEKPGIYFVSLTNKGKVLFTRKLVVKQ